MTNQNIAHYEITAKLGQGGMGEVYRATDTRLDREVAIKVLPEAFARHSERLARFEREAKALAQLNHPNIAAVYGFDRDASRHFLVMELIEGETLSERLQAGPMPIGEALKAFKQIAEALEAAHEKNIIHRDLKPDNIKIDREGRVKVLDFGLAKARLPTTPDPQASTVANTPSTFTMPGKVMGTAAYMSPEQSRGQAVDRRTDVWAFGCCLYEALTGTTPFKGQTASDLMADILKSDPDFTALPPETPSEVVTLLRRCLEKDPQRRLRYLGDIAITLEAVAETSRSHTAVHEVPAGGGVVDGRRNGAAGWWKLIAILALAAVAVMTTLALKRDSATAQIRSLAVLPFENMTADPELNGLDHFIQNAVLTELRKVADLETVNMPATIDALREAKKTELEIAQELAVDGLVIGNVTRQGDEISVLVSVVNGSTGREEVGETLTRPFDELSRIPNDAALAIVDALKIRLQPSDRARVATPGTTNRAAFLAYQRGLELYDLRRLAEAKDQFDAAAKLDPDFTEAKAYAFNAAWFATLWGGTGESPGDYFKKESDNLASLPQNGSDNAAVRLNQIWSALIFERDWRKVRNIYWNTRERDQLTGDDLQIMAVFYSHVECRLQESLQLVREAQALEPERLTYQFEEIWRYYSNGNHTDALRLMEAFPPDKIEGESFFLVLASAGRLDEAQALAERNVGGLKDVEARCELARIHSLKGETEQARTILADLEERAGRGVFVPYAWIARSYAYLSDMDAAFRWLQEGLDHGRGDFSMITLRLEDMLRVFSEEPRYWDIIETMNFPPLPIDHPYYDAEQRMRFGKGSATDSTSQATIRTLAVLPFENAKPEDTESQWLSKTLHEELKKQLKPLRQLEIKPAGFKDADATVKGTFVREADQLYVTVSLENRIRQTDNVLGSFTRPATNIFQLQDEIAIAVAEEIRNDLTEQERRQIAAKSHIDPEAYIAYRQGLFHFDVGSIEGYEQAEREFNEARMLDPNFVDPIIGLANLKWISVVQAPTLVRSQTAFREAREFLEEAKTLDRTHSGVKVLEGWIALMGDWDWRAAGRAFRQAIEADPNNGECLNGLAWYLNLVEGRYAESLSAIRRAIQLDPERLSHRFDESHILRHNGYSEEALARLEEIGRQNPASWEAAWGAALCLQDLGRLKEARERAARAVQLSNREPRALNALAEIEAASGHPQSARAILAELKERAHHGYVPAIELATVQAALGDWDSAFDSLQIAYEERQAGGFIYAIRAPDVMTLFANQPRFWELTDRMGFPGLPLEHPLYEKEREMRFGKASTTPPTAGPPSER